MLKPRKSTALGAAECARRTGLTTKALRVYERHGLILPKRSAQGWRLYGPKELIRLNTIVALKGLGLTLSQIREALGGGTAPSLTRVLRMQLATQRARKAAADKVTRLIGLALAKLDEREPLSIDDLCTLLASAERSERLPVMHDLLAEMFTFEELREWRALDARIPKQDIADAREVYQLSRPIAMQYRALLQQGANPGCAEAQQLLAHHNQLALKYHFRRQWLARARRNPQLARKIYTYSNKLLERSAIHQAAPEGQLLDYMREVRSASRWWRALERLLVLAQELSAREADHGSSVAEELARRFARVCRANGLGDAMEYALWQREFGMSKRNERWAYYDSTARAGWEFLAGAVQRLT
jgi:DNA-binding transcriptional MerR regulator